MYIANYTSGWELYSADQRTPLIMASSKTGSFDMNDNTMAPAFKSYLNNVGNYNYKLNAMDYSYVTKELIAGRAVYARSDDSNSDGGHQFIIDRYRVTTTSSTSTFGWVGTDNYGQDTNEYDENGNVIGHSFFYDRENRTVSYAYSMNWGWSGSNHDNTYFTASDNSDWNAGYHFNTNRQFLK